MCAAGLVVDAAVDGALTLRDVSSVRRASEEAREQYCDCSVFD